MEFRFLQIISANLSRFCTALRFMTILPINWHAEEDDKNFTSSVLYFPIVGLVIGVLGYLLIFGSTGHFPSTVTAFLLVCYLACISGGLHLDGLADSGDGLLCSLPRERRLEIMKDSRLGAMGGIILIIVLLGKYSCLASLSDTELQLAAILMPIGGRSAILLVMGTVGYGRKEGGIGGLFYEKNKVILAFWGVVFLAGATLFLRPGSTLGLVFLVSLVSLMFGRLCKKKLGGATGDTLGATSELVELAVALAFTFHGAP